MSSGWSGPGAKDSPSNKFENDNYARIKAQVNAKEKEKRDAENARRAELGQKPLKDSLWTKTKKGMAKAMKM